MVTPIAVRWQRTLQRESKAQEPPSLSLLLSTAASRSSTAVREVGFAALLAVGPALAGVAIGLAAAVAAFS